ncbi:MAG: hypothetical protein ACYC4P_03080 [Thermoanaerobaculia bacterium]
MDHRDGHPHEHGPGCGHRAIRHGDHADYLHDGHLHSPGDAGVAEHVLAVDHGRPAACAPVECPARHHAGCGHPLVPHGDHLDYLVDGALHHLHGDHCDLHGTV